MKITNALKPLIITASLLFVACSDSPFVEPDTPDHDQPSNSFISISCVNKGAISRANDRPTMNYGQDWENEINDAFIVIYTHPINSGMGEVVKVLKLNANDLGSGDREWWSPTGPSHTYYDNSGNAVNLSGGPGYLTARKYEVADVAALTEGVIDGLTPNTTYYAMAFANMAETVDGVYDICGTLKDKIVPGMPEATNNTREGLRDIIYPGKLFSLNDDVYTLNDSHTGYNVKRNFSHFAMSAINEVKFTTTPDNKVIRLGDFYVQRLAARIDVCFGVQATEYDDRESATANIVSGYIHYAPNTWQNHENVESASSSAGTFTSLQDLINNQNGSSYPLDYSKWTGLYKYDMDVPAPSPTGYPPEGLYRFPIYDENYFQAHNNEGDGIDRGETDRRLDTSTWFWLENIEILNEVSAGENLLQQSTSAASTNGATTFLGTEGIWSNGYPSNFIKSPLYVSGVRGDASMSRILLDVHNLTPEPDDSPTKSNTTLRDEDRVKVRPVPFITNIIEGQWTAKRTIQEYHLAYELDREAYPTPDFERKFHVSSIIGYIGENTYADYNDDNGYTCVRITGKTNLASAFTGGDSGEKYHTLTVTLRLRHSFGNTNFEHPMCWGVVRNTVYKLFLRFYGEGDNLYVRYYYFNGDYAGRENHFSEIPYQTAAFKKYIIDTNDNISLD